jgi:allantoate deiminase
MSAAAPPLLDPADVDPASVDPAEIDPADIERRLLALARHGAHSGTGVWRTAYSPEWVAAQDEVAGWARDLGLSVRQDAVGNLWARSPGPADGPVIVTGSHIDSQCPGGRYDGAAGIVAGLVALSALVARHGPPRRPVEVVSLCEEEGSRFPTAGFWGSRAITGAVAPGDADAVTDRHGQPIAAAMRAVGLDPAAIPTARRTDIAAFLELHIEQGPVLEQARVPVALVTAITGIRHTRVTLTGEANHAGAFPMDLRRDPMAGFAEIAGRAIDHAHRMGRPAVTTVGHVAVAPNAPAIVPASVTFTLDSRHPDPSCHAGMAATHAALIAEVAARRGLVAEVTPQFDLSPVPCDAALLATMDAAARSRGIPVLRMASGAGHDTQRMARICPAAMIFVRSAGGRSHCPEEYSTPGDLAAGAAVLAGTLLRLAW